MLRRVPTNEDMLAWFAPHERSRCAACGREACVTAAEGAAAVCLACGAVWSSAGERLDVDGRIE